MSRKKPKNHILVKLARKIAPHNSEWSKTNERSFFAKTLDPVCENSTKHLDLHRNL